MIIKKFIIIELDNEDLRIIGNKIILKMESLPMKIKICEELSEAYFGNCQEKKVLNITANNKLQLT
jgi:hypothetical protein